MSWRPKFISFFQVPIHFFQYALSYNLSFFPHWSTVPLLTYTKLPNVFGFISRFSIWFHSPACLFLSSYHITSVSSSVTYMYLISGNLTPSLLELPCLFPFWGKLWKGPVTRWFDYLLPHCWVLRSEIFPLVSAYLWPLQGITEFLVIASNSLLFCGISFSGLLIDSSWDLGRGTGQIICGKLMSGI